MSDEDTEYLPYRTPYDWNGVLGFLRGHVTVGVDLVEDDAYARTAREGGRVGVVHVSHAPERRALRVKYDASLSGARAAIAARLRRLFDTEFDPRAVNAFLARDPLLARATARNPGMRVPGAYDHFELLIRSILGQQITVKAANTLAGRFSAAFGDEIPGADPRLRLIAPTPERAARCAVEEITALGIVRARAACILDVARAVAEGRVAIEDSDDPELFIARITTLRGIGPWTAHYLAMRALHWTDAFPKEDIALRAMLGGVKAHEAERRSQAWRPWRSYAVMHLWREYLAERAAAKA